jgi:Tol biopolymer transport system component
VVDLRRQERTLVRYTQLGGRAQWPRWSPDGRWIGFQRLRGASRPHPIELWVIRPDGSGLRRLPLVGAFNNLDINPDAGEQAWDWSPDGRHVVFQHRDPLIDYDDDFGGDIAVAEIGTGKQHVLGVGRHPDWSPRRHEIAYAHDNLYVARADGRSRRRIGLPFAPTTPSWSPDGARIAFVGEPDLGGPAAVYVVNRDGSGLRRLARADPVQPQWSPDGAWIGFSDRDSIMRVSARGGLPVRVTRPGIYLGWGLDWR